MSCARTCFRRELTHSLKKSCIAVIAAKKMICMVVASHYHQREYVVHPGKALSKVAQVDALSCRKGYRLAYSCFCWDKWMVAITWRHWKRHSDCHDAGRICPNRQFRIFPHATMVCPRNHRFRFP